MAATLLNNRYRITRALGSGGFGETFLADDTHLPSGRPCVIKQLKPVNDNPQMYEIVKQRFQREAAVLEDVGEGSNQIPKLYAYFPEGGQFYLVQEWIEGVTLTKKVQAEGVQSESAVRKILESLLPVLDYVHSKRMVHRDIKPDNIIMRQRDGLPVLIDFGAVKEAMGADVNTQGNSTNSIVVGTPGFMSAEQAAGKPLYSSDVYSLALTAIYMLTGKIPQELDLDSRSGEFIWQQHARNISPNLAAVLDKAIQSHPRDRYSSAREMLDALRSQPSPAVAPSMSEMETVAVSPGNNRPVVVPPPRQPTIIQWDWQKTAIVGGAIAAFLIIAAIFARPKPAVDSAGTQQATSPIPTTPASNQTGEAAKPNNPTRSPSPPTRNQPESTPVPSEITPSPPTRNQPEPTPVPSETTPAQPTRNQPEPTPVPSETTPAQPTSPGISVSTERVRFSAGGTGTTLGGNVSPNQRKRYLVRAQQGQKFSVEVLQGDVNVAAIAPNGQTLGNVSAGNSQWQISLPRTGDYTVEISSPNGSDYAVDINVLSENAASGTTNAPSAETSPTPSATSQTSADEAVRDYYSKLINNNQYQVSWTKLSRRFQKNHSGNSYNSYLKWWEQVDRVEVRQVRLVDPGKESAVVDVRLQYYMKDGGVSQDSQRLWLIWDAGSGSWLIDDRIYR